MARNLTASMAAAVQAAVLRPALFYEGLFASSGSPSEQYLRLWSGYGSITWDGKVWTGGGNLLRISPIEESARIEAPGFTVTLSGMPSANQALALNSGRKGFPGKLWLGLMEESAYLALPGLSGNYGRTPDNSALGITGDIDLRAKVALADWSPTATSNILSKAADGTNRSWRFDATTAGALAFRWSPDSSGTEKSATSTANLSALTAGTVKWVRVTLDVNNGAAGQDCRFYTSDDGIAWTQLGSTVTVAGVTAIYNDTAPVEIGSAFSGGLLLLTGSVYRAQIYNGIDGTLVADFDPRRFSGGALTATMETGEVWTIAQSITGSPTPLPARIVNEAESVLADPYQLEDGLFDFTVTEDDGETCTIVAQYESRLIELFKPRIRRYTHEDQKLDYPTDLGFEYVASLQDKLLIWGGPGAASSELAKAARANGRGNQPGDNDGVGTSGAARNRAGREYE